MAALAEGQLATRLAPKSYTAHKVLGDILKEQKKLSQANAAYEVAEMMRMSQAAVSKGAFQMNAASAAETKKTLNRRDMLKALKVKNPQMPTEILEAAQNEIIKIMSEGLSQGRPIALRGFGRFIVRRYTKSQRKSLGIIFRPSPFLIKLLNPHIYER